MSPVSSRRFLGLWTLLVLLLLPLQAASSADCVSKPILKSVETVVLMAGSQKKAVKARVDTGASYASLDSTLARELKLDRYPLRTVKITNAHGVSERKLVEVKFVLQGQVKVAEFTLIPRDHLAYPVLLGRKSLKGFLVDPAE